MSTILEMYVPINRTVCVAINTMLLFIVQILTLYGSQTYMCYWCT